MLEVGDKVKCIYENDSIDVDKIFTINEIVRDEAYDVVLYCTSGGIVLKEYKQLYRLLGTPILFEKVVDTE